MDVWMEIHTYSRTNLYVKKAVGALAGVAQWTERWPVNQRVTGSMPSQGTGLGCGPGPQ